MGDHVFICYARQDQDFVLKLAANLKERGVPVWLDQWDIPASADWDLTIDNALYDCAQFLIVLSPAARASREVRGELRTALDENKLIVPVLYQTCRIPRQLRLIQHVDFTACGPDDGAALGQVLGALGVSEPSRPTPKVRRREKAAPARRPFEPEMVLIPAGEFLYGRKKKKVILPEFWIDKTPVTNAEYARFVADTGHKPPKHWKGKAPPKKIADHPVTYVSWPDARAYAKWAGKRLPTEKEWEKAARGSDGREYPWGDGFDPNRCNTKESGIGKTTPVGKYSPQGDSPYGCVDMAGNVQEWTATYVGILNAVRRGGSWNHDQKHAYCTSGTFDSCDPWTRSSHVGFRCARGSQ
jgi:formylglycine-generating enzyme required for sulfatase activity